MSSPSLIQTALALVPLLYFSPWSGMFVSLAVAGFTVITTAEAKRRRPFRKTRHDDYARDFGMFSECVEYVHPVVQFGQTERILGQYGQLQKQIASRGIEDVKLASRFAWWRSTLLSAAKRGCQAIWLWQFRKGALDGAMVMYLNTLIEDLFNSFAGYAGLLKRLHDGIEPTRTLITLLDEKPAFSLSDSERPVAVAEAVDIQMRNVGFSAHRGRTARICAHEQRSA